MSAERWRAIDGFPDYEVSDTGRVRSWLTHGSSRRRASAPHILKATPRRGYPAVCLVRADRSKVTKAVHRLVAAAFIGRPPSGMEVAHSDGDPMNSALSNLRYATRLENEADKEIHGTRPRGAATNVAKLSPAEVAAIRAAIGAGVESRAAIARRFGVSRALVYKIAVGQVWRHLPEVS